MRINTGDMKMRINASARQPRKHPTRLSWHYADQEPTAFHIQPRAGMLSQAQSEMLAC